MYIRRFNPCSYLYIWSKHVKHLSTSNVLKPYPSYMERQIDVSINTSSGEDFVEIASDSNVKVQTPSTPMPIKVNYIDTNPLGDKKQPIVLLVHGYPGNHESMKSFVEEFQRRNFRCIAPDMPYCGKTTMPVWSGMIWSNSTFLRARFLGELLKAIMKDRLVPIHTAIGLHENAYSLMSLVDQYEYIRCSSLILVDPAPRKLIRFLPTAKLAFDFGRLPLHWPMAKFLLRTLGYKDLLTYSQRDIMGALRIWMLENTHQYDAYIHNLWLSRLRTMVVLSEIDEHLNRKLLDALIKDLSVVPFNKSNMANVVLKKYACNHNELLTDRISYVVDDIETFLSTTLMSPAAATMNSLSSTAKAAKDKEKIKFVQPGNNKDNENELDVNAYQRASVNDFFTNAFGPGKADLKPNETHSLRSVVEAIAGDFVQRAPSDAKRERLENVKDEMRKKKIRIDVKS